MAFTFGAPAPSAGDATTPAPSPAPPQGATANDHSVNASSKPSSSTPAAAPLTGFSLNNSNSTTAINTSANSRNATQTNDASTNATTTSDQPKSIATIPPYSSAFPRSEIQRRVEASLGRWKQQQSQLDGDGGSSLSFAAGELIHLLGVDKGSSSQNEGGGGGGGEDEGENYDGGRRPVGQHLANPTSLLKFSAPNANLRRQLQLQPHIPGN